MGKQRKRHPAQLKAKVALEAIRDERTITELAVEYGVHPNQISKWKKQALEELPSVFSDGRKRRDEAEEQEKAKLYEQIGRLKVELDWLKKKLGTDY